MNINNLTKRKLKLFINLLGNLIVATVISIIIYFILALFFENTLSDLVARLNYDLYSWIVYNRDIVVYVYIGIVLAVIIYKFIFFTTTNFIDITLNVRIHISFYS